MKSDLLKQYRTLQNSLLEEKARLESRLVELTRALGAESQLLTATQAPATAISAGASGSKRNMSAAGRARIIAAQKARWAKYNAEKGTPSAAPKKAKRKMSAAWRAKIALAAKARWAKAKKAGKNSL